MTVKVIKTTERRFIKNIIKYRYLYILNLRCLSPNNFEFNTAFSVCNIDTNDRLLPQ